MRLVSYEKKVASHKFFKWFYNCFFSKQMTVSRAQSNEYSALLQDFPLSKSATARFPFPSVQRYYERPPYSWVFKNDFFLHCCGNAEELKCTAYQNLCSIRVLATSGKPLCGWSMRLTIPKPFLNAFCSFYSCFQTTFKLRL